MSRPVSPGPEGFVTAPHDQDGKRKRKRAILSCTDCRRRKLKCDRGFPACSRCQKVGTTATCTYDSVCQDLTPANDDEAHVAEQQEQLRDLRRHQANHYPTLIQQNTPVTEVHKGMPDVESLLYSQAVAINRLQNKVASLEAAAIQSQRGESQNTLNKIEDIKSIGYFENRSGFNAPETALFKGKGVQTQFYGASNPVSMLAHVRIISHYDRPVPR